MSDIVELWWRCVTCGYSFGATCAAAGHGCRRCGSFDLRARSRRFGLATPTTMGGLSTTEQIEDALDGTVAAP